MDHQSFEQGRQQGRQEANTNDDGDWIYLGFLLACFAALIAVWALFYPLAAVVGIVTWLLLHTLFSWLFGGLEGFAHALLVYIIPLVTSIAALWFSSRLDHSLAQRQSYRTARHIIRMTMLGFVVLYLQMAAEMGGDNWPELTSFSDVERLLGDLSHNVAAFIVVLACHFWLWNLRWFRSPWHDKLESLRLRPDDLTD